MVLLDQPASALGLLSRGFRLSGITSGEELARGKTRYKWGNKRDKVAYIER